MRRARVSVPRKAARLLDYWRAERRTLRHGSVALFLSTLASFGAGLVLGAMNDTLERLPGLFILIPASVGMRGVISGSTGARLGTSIAAGLFDVSWARGSVLRINATVGIVLTLVSSVYVAVLARAAASVFGEPSIPLTDLITISVVGGSLGAVLVLIATVGLAAASFRRGWDLDTVATPVITAVGDMVTLPALLLASLLVELESARPAIAIACLAATAFAVVLGLRGGQVIRRVLVEMTAALLLVPILDVLAGSLLEARSAQFLAYPALLILIPPFISQAGALGGILSSRLSSKLAVGVISTSGVPERPALIDATVVSVYAVVIFAVIGALGVALGASLGLAAPGSWVTVGGTVLAGLIVLPILLAMGYYLAVGTTRFGLDPDNLSIPLITGVMDLAGIAAVLLAMSLSGVDLHG
jgi:mgtE-like transporter